MEVKEKYSKDYVNIHRTLFFKIRHYVEKTSTIVGWLDNQKDTSDNNIVFIKIHDKTAIIDLNGRQSSFLSDNKKDLVHIINESIHGELGLNLDIDDIKLL